MGHQCMCCNFSAFLILPFHIFLFLFSQVALPFIFCLFLPAGSSSIRTLLCHFVLYRINLALIHYFVSVCFKCVSSSIQAGANACVHAGEHLVLCGWQGIKPVTLNSHHRRPFSLSFEVQSWATWYFPSSLHMFKQKTVCMCMQTWVITQSETTSFCVLGHQTATSW